MDDGTVYCYDRDEQTWVKFRVTPVDSASLPKKVIDTLTEIAVKKDGK
jgi:hypothetical protein